MMLKARIKWYGVVSGCLFLMLSVYLLVAYTLTDLRVDRMLKYLWVTAGLSALIFGASFLLEPALIKFNAEWYGVLSACVFLVVSTYILRTHIFYDLRVGKALSYVEFTAALLALIFGLLSFPKRQSYFALVVWLYSFYVFSQPPFAVS